MSDPTHPRPDDPATGHHEAPAGGPPPYPQHQGQPYTGTGQPHPGQQVVYVQEPKNGLGIAALVLGIVGVLFGLIPLTGFLAFILGVIAVILGLANRGRLKRERATNRKTTWAGVITGVLAIALGIWGMVVVFTAVDQFGDDMDCLANADTAEEIDAC